MSQYDAIREMQREIRWLKNEMAKRPIKTRGGTSTPVMTLTIIGGNTLSDGVTLGVKWVSSAITTVPSLYDPTVTSAFIDGIGRATLKSNGSTVGTVLVANYSGNGGPITVALFQGDILLTASNTVTIPLSGDPTQSVSCYVPYSP